MSVSLFILLITGYYICCITHSSTGSEECENGFVCKTFPIRTCIPHHQRCDHHIDCDNGEDEEDCFSKKTSALHLRGLFFEVTECLPNQYRCPGTSKCIQLEQVCDLRVDCHLDQSDEGNICVQTEYIKRECLKCKDDCRNTLDGPRCVCSQQGYTQINGTCVDINECLYRGTCPQRCENTPGSYSCYCEVGYRGSEGNHTCTAINDPKDRATSLLYSTDKYVTQVDLSGSYNHPEYFNYSFVNVTVTDIDYSFDRNLIYWLQQTNTSTMIQTFHTIQSDVFDTSPLPFRAKRFAFDWLRILWYIVDDASNTIVVCHKKSILECHTAVEAGMNRIRDIVIDPVSGWLFYSHWLVVPAIQRCRTHGEELQSIVTKNINRPYGLTIDMANLHVYWSDSYLDSISRCDYDGHNRAVIYQGPLANHIQSLVVFEMYVYALNRYDSSIVRFHRLDLSVKPSVISYNIFTPRAIKIVHRQRQPKPDEKDPCEDLQSKCSGFCYPYYQKHHPRADCDCQTGYISDGKNCHKIDTKQVILYACRKSSVIGGIALIMPDQPDIYVTTRPYDAFRPIAVRQPTAVTFSNKLNTLYYSDAGSIMAINVSSNSPRIIKSDVVTYGLSMDWTSNTLYWSDYHSGTINVKALDSDTYTTILSARDYPCDIVVAPTQG